RSHANSRLDAIGNKVLNAPNFCLAVEVRKTDRLRGLSGLFILLGPSLLNAEVDCTSGSIGERGYVAHELSSATVAAKVSQAFFIFKCPTFGQRDCDQGVYVFLFHGPPRHESSGRRSRGSSPASAGPPAQYSSGRSMQVEERSASVMIQTFV